MLKVEMARSTNEKKEWRKKYGYFRQVSFAGYISPRCGNIVPRNRLALETWLRPLGIS